MTTLAALALGLLIGTVIGGLGGGGAVLTVPALVYLLGLTARDATTTSLLIVGLVAVIGAVDHGRAHGLRWRTALAFGVVGAGAAYAGTAVNRLLDEQLLLLGFAGLITVAAVAMLAGGHPDTDDEHEQGSRVRAALAVIAVGVLVGFLTGLFGVGGGFIVVPALVLALRVPMTIAVGTSLLVIAINSAAALGFHAGDAEVDWAVTTPFAAAAVVGTLAGRRIADRLSGEVLTRAFAAMLLVVAAAVAVANLPGL